MVLKEIHLPGVSHFRKTAIRSGWVRNRAFMLSIKLRVLLSITILPPCKTERSGKSWKINMVIFGWALKVLESLNGVRQKAGKNLMMEFHNSRECHVH